MAKETKTVNLRIPAEQIEYLEKFDSSINQTIVEIIDRIRMIERYADRDIKGVFTEAEWKYMADSLNGTLVEGDFRYYAAALNAGLEDSATYEGLDEKWCVNTNQLTDKVSKMSSSAIEAIHRRVEAFWANPQQDIDEWAKF